MSQNDIYRLANGGVRHVVGGFAIAMEAKLRHNDHKGGWADTSISFLLKRLEEEVKELGEALTNQAPDHAVSEAVDVANFAMMIADKLNGLGIKAMADNRYLTHSKQERGESKKCQN